MNSLNLAHIQNAAKRASGYFEQICTIGVHFYLAAFVVFGVVASILIPPFQAPDENVHWLSGYNRTMTSLFGDIASDHCSIANVLPGIFDTNRIAFKANQKIRGKNYNLLTQPTPECSNFTLGYGYIGTYPGLLLARLITADEATSGEKTFQVFLLSRIIQGLLIAVIALRLIVLVRKYSGYLPGLFTTFCIFISPLFIQQSFAVSADGITFALSLSLLIFFFYLKECRWFDWALLFFLAFSVGMTKPPLFGMIPILLLGGFIRSYGISFSKERNSKIIFLLAILCIFTALFASVWMTLLPHPTPPEQMLGRDLSIVRQLKFTLQNPFFVLRILFHTVFAYLNFFNLTGPLGWLDTPLSPWTLFKVRNLIVVGVFFDSVYFFSIALSSEKKEWSRKFLCEKFLTGIGGIIALFVTLLLVALTLYLTWSPVGASQIDGLQGRYLFPGLLGVPLLIGSLVPLTHATTEIKRQNIIKVIFSLFFMILLLSMLTPFYLDMLRRWW